MTESEGRLRSQPPPAGVVVGVDVGATKLAAARLEEGGFGAVVRRPSGQADAESALAEVAAVVREAAGQSELAAVGLSVAAQLELASGRVLEGDHLPLAGVPLRDELESRLATPVVLDNDGNCAALAEWRALGSPPAADLVALTLGTGVGGGAVLGGRTFHGRTGVAPELGHLVVDGDGPSCFGTCPNRGCLEALCSGSALARDGLALARERPESELGRRLADRGTVTAEDVVAAARGGDGAALQLMERLGHWLGAGISSLVNLFEPSHVVIGGGLATESDLFIDAARREAASRIQAVRLERLEISVSGYGPYASLAGATLLPLAAVAGQAAKSP